MVYMHGCMWVYMGLCAYVFVRVHWCGCTWVCVCVGVGVHGFVCALVWVYMGLCVHLGGCGCIWVCVCIGVDVHGFMCATVWVMGAGIHGWMGKRADMT